MCAVKALREVENGSQTMASEELCRFDKVYRI